MLDKHLSDRVGQLVLELWKQEYTIKELQRQLEVKNDTKENTDADSRTSGT